MLLCFTACLGGRRIKSLFCLLHVPPPRQNTVHTAVLKKTILDPSLHLGRHQKLMWVWRKSVQYSIFLFFCNPADKTNNKQTLQKTQASYKTHPTGRQRHVAQVSVRGENLTKTIFCFLQLESGNHQKKTSNTLSAFKFFSVALLSTLSSLSALSSDVSNICRSAACRQQQARLNL